MTDELPQLDPEDALREEAKKLVALPPDPIPDAVGLPDDVRDGHIEDTP